MTAFDRISVGSAGWVEVPTGNSRTVDVYWFAEIDRDLVQS